MDQDIEQTIKSLRLQRYFKQVDWNNLKENTKMTEIQKKFAYCDELELVMDNNESVSFKTSMLVTSVNDSPSHADEDSGGDEYKRVRRNTGKASYRELMNELRIKYLTILKSLYWNKFEKGQMSGDSVIVLLESAEFELDEFESPIADWADIERQIGDSDFSWIEQKLSTLPIIGDQVRKRQFKRLSTAYEIVVNFVEAHEKTAKLIMEII